MAKCKLDKAITELEKAEQEATQILDDYTDVLVTGQPEGSSWGVTRYNQIMKPAGSRLNYLAALKQLKDRLLGS
jgi:hypothetical protein